MRTLAAFATVVIVTTAALKLDADKTARHIQDTQIAACVRGNLLRRESNRRIAAHTADRDVLAAFLKAAVIARQRSGKPYDLQAAREYRRLIVRLHGVQFDPVPLVDCRKAVLHP